MIGTSALVIDTAHGVFDSHNYFPIYYNDYGSIENAVSAADQLARQRHIHHIYIAANLGVMEGIKYFSQNIHTPVTIFDNAHCLVLPGTQVGPVVYMDAPYSPLAETLLHQYANATLISQLKRMGGDPFNLYVLSPKSTPRTTVSPQQDFTSTLQLQEPQAHYISASNESWMVTHWQLAQSASSDWRTTYDYAFRANLTGQAVDPNEPADECVMTRVQAGDHLFVGFDFSSLQGQVPTTVSLEVQYLIFKPWLLHFGPIRFQTFDDRIDQDLHLHMLNRQEALTLPGA